MSVVGNARYPQLARIVFPGFQTRHGESQISYDMYAEHIRVAHVRRLADCTYRNFVGERGRQVGVAWCKWTRHVRGVSTPDD